MNENFTPSRPISEAQSELINKMHLEVTKKDYKAVSFKMMDILVTYPFSEQEDLFMLMEKDFTAPEKAKRTFTELRTAAEEAADKKYGLKDCMTIDKIYEIFRKLSGVSKEESDRLMRRECELAEQYAIPRECGKNLFLEAKNSGKKVIVTAETIYPSDVVRYILNRCGMDGYDCLIVASELNIPDSDSKSYLDEVIKKAEVSPQKLLHIGGDISGDVETPIMKGAKALLIQPVIPLMIKSGRLRGFIQEKHVYDYDTEQFFALHCVLGMYAVYAFDVPQNKLPQSDFCGDAYMLGFVVLGALSLCKDFSPASKLQEAIVLALEKNPEAVSGRDDFTSMLRQCFGETLDEYGCEGCTMPLEFLEKHSYGGDRNIISQFISADIAKKWSKSVKEPSLAPVYAGKVKKNALARLADKLFPPGTRVRTIVDDILTKGRKI